MTGDNGTYTLLLSVLNILAIIGSCLVDVSILIISFLYVLFVLEKGLGERLGDRLGSTKLALLL